MVRARNTKKDPNHIPRPMNSFFLFRKNFNASLTQQKKTQGKRHQRQVSGAARAAWKALSPAEKKVWIDRAAEADAEHKRMYPNYRYRPNSVNRGGVVSDDEDEEDEEMTAARDDDDYVPPGTPCRSPRARNAKAKRSRTPEPAIEEGLVPTPISAPSTPTANPAPIVPTAFAPMYYHQPVRHFTIYRLPRLTFFPQPAAFDNYYPEYQYQQQFDPEGMDTSLDGMNVYQPRALIPASSLGPQSFTGPAPPNQH